VKEHNLIQALLIVLFWDEVMNLYVLKMAFAQAQSERKFENLSPKTMRTLEPTGLLRFIVIRLQLYRRRNVYFISHVA
jgi:hypothetical protein